MSFSRVFGAARNLAKSLLIRAVPGLLNLAALVALGSRLDTGEFGIYSTSVATSSLLGSLILGPILSGVLPEINKGHWSGAEAKRFMGLIVTLILGTFAVTQALTPFLPGYEPALLAVASCGGMSVLQEILRGQLRLWGYTVVALLQAAIYAGFSYTVIDAGEGTLALWIFALSYLAGTIVAYCLLGFPRPRLKGLFQLRRTVTIGSTYTLSLLFESGMSVGSRYLIVWFGGKEFLGIYSFSLDLAQRVVAFLVNAASFMYVPLAYRKAEASQDADGEFRAVLIEGALVGGGAALLSLTAILAGKALGLLPDDISHLIVPTIFIPVALGMTINRLKKTVVDPMAMRSDKTSAILLGFMTAGPLTLASGAAALLSGHPVMVAYTLPVGYFLAALVTWRIIHSPAGSGAPALQNR